MRVVKHINEADQNLSKNNGRFGSCRRLHSRPSWKTSPNVGVGVASHAGVFREEIRAPLKTPAWEARVGATTMKLHDYGRASFLPLL